MDVQKDQNNDNNNNIDQNTNNDTEPTKSTEQFEVEDEDITQYSVFKQLWMVGAYPVLLLLLLDWIAKSAAILVIPIILLDIFQGNVSNSSYASGGLQGLTFTLQLIMSPIMGNFSDKYGRKPFIMLVNIFVMSAYICLMVTTSVAWKVKLPGFFVGIFFFGLASPVTLLCTAWMIDKSVLKNKTQNIGAMGAAISIGFILGATVSVLIGRFAKQPHVVFYVDVGVAALEIIISFFFIKESKIQHKEEMLKVVPWYSSNPFSTLYWMFNVEFLPPFIFLIFFANLAHDIMVSNFVLWAHFRFGWNNFQVGITLLIYGLAVAFTQGVLIRIVLPWAGEKILLFFSLAIGGLAYLAFGLVPTEHPWIIFIIAPFLGIHSFAHPVIVGLLSRQVEKHEQGRLLAGTDIIKLTGAIIGAFGSTTLFGALVEKNRKEKLPNVIFFIAAALMALSMMVGLFIFSQDTTLMMMEKEKRHKDTHNTLTAPFSLLPSLLLTS